MDQSSGLDQIAPLDLSTSKSSKIDSKQFTDAPKDSMENSSIEKETIVPWSTGPVPDISKAQSPITQRSSSATIVTTDVILKSTTSLSVTPSNTQPASPRSNKIEKTKVGILTGDTPGPDREYSKNFKSILFECAQT